MKYLTGKELLNCATFIDPEGIHIGDREYGWDDESVTAGICLNDVWFYQDMSFDDYSMTHNEIEDILKDEIGDDGHINGEFLNENYILFSKKSESIFNVEDIDSRYNFRYFYNFRCLAFWGDKNQINPRLISDLVRALKIKNKDLVISFFNNGSFKAYLIKNLNLSIYRKIKNVSPIGKFNSSMLHMIACQKRNLGGFGSRKLKHGMPLTVYNQLKMTSE
jgi:hypothetical protein